MSKALTKEEMSLNAHVEDLRERMRMLQNDRTANIDVLEANKSANKEEIKRLRGDNKDFRQKLSQLQRVRLFFALTFCCWFFSKLALLNLPFSLHPTCIFHLATLTNPTLSIRYYFLYLIKQQ